MVWGDTRRFQVDITDDLGDPVELDSGDMIVTGRVRYTSGTPLFEKTVGDGITYDEDVVGRAELVLDPFDLAALGNDYHRLVFDVRFYVAGDACSPSQGTLRVTPSIGDLVS